MNYKFFLCVGLCVFSLGGAKAYALDEVQAESNKRQLAAVLHEVWGIRAQSDRLIDSIVVQLPVEKQEEFRAYMSRVLSLKESQDLSANTAVNLFTQEELEVMNSYYRSAAGQSAEVKREHYHAIVMSTFKTMMEKGVAESMNGFKELEGIPQPK